MGKHRDGDHSLAQARLRELLHYDPSTGVFTRLVAHRGVAVGTVAGSLKPSGYVLLDVECHRYRAHRLAWFYMTGEWPQTDVDHKNTVRNDNRWENLRLADNQQNQANSRISRDNTSGFKGVVWSRQRGKWQAKINPNRRQVHLGFYDRIEDAAAAYEAGAKKYFGEFARAA